MVNKYIVKQVGWSKAPNFGKIFCTTLISLSNETENPL